MASGNSTVTYKDIPNFPGYRVGDDGSVWSRWARSYSSGVIGCQYVLGSEWHPMKPNRSKRYATVQLSGETRYVHLLVLETFVGPCPDGMEARHFPDNDPANNRLGNLQWSTHAENIADKVTHGTTLRGERNPKCKLTAEQVRAIRTDYAAGVRQVDLAARHHVTRQLVHRIIKRRCWAHLE
jgi:hypothetical protein